MYEIWIEDRAGNRLGDGPIITGQDWTAVRRLRLAGTFSFAMPMSDPRRNLVRLFRYAHAWHFVGDHWEECGYGKILRVEPEAQDGAPWLRVSGDDLFRELAEAGTDDLDLSDEVWIHPAEFFLFPKSNPIGDEQTNHRYLENSCDDDAGTADIITAAEIAASRFVIRHPEAFHAVKFVFRRANGGTTGQAAFVWYWNGPETFWDVLGFTDSTQRQQATWTRDGEYRWDMPDGWQIATGECGYKIRIEIPGAGNQVEISDLRVLARRPCVDGLQRIMASAPDGWTLDVANGYASTQPPTLVGPNLLVNGSFETVTGTVDDGVADTFAGWTSGTVGAPNSPVVEAVSGAAAGAKALKLSTQGGAGYAIVEQDVTLEGGMDYRLSASTKGDGTHPGQLLIGSGSTWLTPLLRGDAANEWRSWIYDFTVPLGGSYRVRLYSGQPLSSEACAAYWDDVQLRLRVAGEVYQQFSGESTMEKLSRIAEQTGENYILGLTGRRVLWLGPDARPAGVRAVSHVNPIGAENAPEIALIKSLSWSQEGYEIFSRVRPLGGGTGVARITLAECTRGAPDGYTIDRAGGWLVRNQTEAEIGRIEKILDYPDINAADSSESQRGHAANMLLDRAWMWLQRHSCTNTDLDDGDIPRAVELELVKCDRAVLPGHMVYVDYEDWRAGVRVMKLDGEFWVLESELSYDGAGGVATTRLVLSTVDAWPTDEKLLIAEYLRRVRAFMGHTQAEQGYSSARITDGIKSIDVRNGRVVRVRA